MFHPSLRIQPDRRDLTLAVFVGMMCALAWLAGVVVGMLS